MVASDLIGNLRLRLRDTKESNWTTDMLLECINTALQKVSRDLLLFKEESEYDISSTQKCYPLPNHKIRTISVSIDEKPIVFKSFDFVVANADKIGSIIIAYETQDGISITNSPKKGRLKISYNTSRRIESEAESIPTPDFAEEALTLYSLYLANQREASEKSFTKSTTYLALYKEEIALVKAAINKNYFSKNITTDYQVV